MELKGEKYSVTYDDATSTITCRGTLRLQGTAGYTDIMNMLNNAADRLPQSITLNLGELQFLNSSGINTFSKFVINVRNQASSQLIILGSNNYPWQKKSLKNLKRLMPDLTLEME